MTTAPPEHWLTGSGQASQRRVISRRVARRSRTVAFDPEAIGASFANATIDEVARPGHNVVVLVPGNVVDPTVSSSRGVHSILVEPAHLGATTSPSLLEVEFADAQIAPTSVSAFAPANSQLEAYPLRSTTPLGSLVGKGLFVTQLAYSVTATARAVLFKRFGGLITAVSLGTAPSSHLAAWEANLWVGTSPRNVTLTTWGHRANVVLADGVEYRGIYPSGHRPQSAIGACRT